LRSIGPCLSRTPLTGRTRRNLDHDLRDGFRGLPGGSSLPQLLAKRRGVRNLGDLPPLTENKLLAWADRHRARTGKWPNWNSGPVARAPGEDWRNIDQVLRGGRGLPGGDSLPRLLARRRGARNPCGLPTGAGAGMLTGPASRCRRC
jgi:hypothetical protein